MVNEQKEETATNGVDTQNGNGEVEKVEESSTNGDAAVKNGEPVKNGEAAKTEMPPKRPEEPQNTYTNLEVCFYCGVKATGICEKCGLVGYCEIHKNLHRPDNFCFPFMVEKREGVGRILVATRDIDPLELILWDNAAAMGPRMGGKPVCLQCLKPPKPGKLCGLCGWPVCDEKCEAGYTHKLECCILAESIEKPDFSNLDDVLDVYRCIAPLRLLLVKNKFPEIWERLSYLMDHNEDRVKDPELWNLYQENVNKYLKVCGQEFSDEDINRAVGLLWTNSFACASGGGQAIFPTFSFASHSCKPNCAHSVFPNKTLALQAKEKIKAGEEFTISYISTLQGLLKRRSKLRDKWFFECTCPRCQDPTECGSHASTFICQVCKTPDALVTSSNSLDPKAEWNCSKCPQKTQPEDIIATENRIAEQMQKLAPSSMAEFESFHEDVALELHPSHYLMLILKRHLIALYNSCLASLELEDLERVESYCKCVDDAYNIIDPGYQKDRGSVLRTMCEVKKMIAKKRLADGMDNEEQFKKRVQDCCEVFQEAQKCNFVRVKKDPNEFSKFAVVQRRDVE